MKAKQKRWEDLSGQEKATGILVTIIFVAIAFWGISSIFDKSGQNTENKQAVKPIEKVNVVVTSQIVKKIEGKCRYFFDVRNKDTKPFEGSVAIQLYNNELKNQLAGDTFDTKRAIEPELGFVVYTDADTCPTSVHGSTGMTKFKYTVKVDNDEVNSGEGIISKEFEDTDAYNF